MTIPPHRDEHVVVGPEAAQAKMDQERSYARDVVAATPGFVLVAIDSERNSVIATAAFLPGLSVGDMLSCLTRAHAATGSLISELMGDIEDGTLETGDPPGG